MNKLFKKIACFAFAGIAMLSLVACGTVQGEEPEDLNLSIWDGQTITSVEELKTKVVEEGQSVSGKKYHSIEINDAADFVAAMRDINNFENFTIKLQKDIDMADMPWNSAIVDGSVSATDCTITINGNNKTIYGLSNMLISNAGDGRVNLEIKNLTISQANIAVDVNNVNSNIAVGAFVGNIGAGVNEVTFSNCHLENSLVNGGNWTGGIFGIAAGSSEVGNAEFVDVLVSECSVRGSLISGKGIVGGIAGQSTADVWTKVEINSSSVVNNEIKSLSASNVNAGVAIGSVGVAGDEITVDSVAKTGGTYINNFEYSYNDVYSNGTLVSRIYGDLADGKLYINGALID